MEQADMVITTRIPRKLRQLMEKYITIDTHMNESEFIREAIREKIKRDAPQLYEQLWENMEM